MTYGMKEKFMSTKLNSLTLPQLNTRNYIRVSNIIKKFYKPYKMQFLYGTRERNIDVTEILFREGGKINQSYNSLFGDPVFGIRKTLFWLRYGKDTIEIDEDQPISLNINRYEIIWNYEKFKQNYVNQEGIPKYMIRTGPYELEDLPEDFYGLLIETKERNPAYQQVYFSDLDCLSFIRENYPQYLPEYEVLIPGAFKADLFRALFLYKYGGVYNDLGQRYFVPVSEIIEDREIVLVADIINFGKEGIFNGFMASRSGKPLLFCYIELMVKRIRERSYTDSMLCITGPGCFWDAFCMYYNYSGPSLRGVNRYEEIKIIHHSDAERILYDNDKLVIKLKIYGYKDILYKNKKHYGDLWLERNVYKTTYGIWDYKTLKEKYNYSGQGIPKIMLRTYESPIKDLINPLYLLIKKTEEDNPDYQQVYFDADDRVSFMKENFPQYLPEYEVLIPKTYKVDLFRILFLYKYGGIYNDIPQEYLVPVDQIIGNNRMVLTSDRWTGKWGIYSFMAFQPGEELVKTYFELIIERIRSRGYYFNPLDITGPTCFWDAFVKYFNHPPEESIRELKEYKWIKLYHFCQEGTHITDGNTLIMKTKTEMYHNMIYPDRSQHYHNLWHKRKVYSN
jgi:mannosyltransferase OCH1-like enzyme